MSGLKGGWSENRRYLKSSSLTNFLELLVNF